MSNNNGKGIIDSAADTVITHASIFASDFASFESALWTKRLFMPSCCRSKDCYSGQNAQGKTSNVQEILHAQVE